MATYWHEHSPGVYSKMKRKAPYTKTPASKRQRSDSYAMKRAVLRSKTDELKNVDTLANVTIVASQTAASLALLNGIDDGNTAITRIGRKVVLTSLSYRWRGSLATTTVGSSGLRLLIVYDRQANAAAPVATDILTQDTIEAMMNLNNSKRFKIITDQIIECCGTQGPQSWNIKGHIQFEKPNKGKAGLEQTFNSASTATITSITTGSIYALFYQDGTLTTANPISAFYSRIRFIDA